MFNFSYVVVVFSSLFSEEILFDGIGFWMFIEYKAGKKKKRKKGNVCLPLHWLVEEGLCFF